MARPYVSMMTYYVFRTNRGARVRACVSCCLMLFPIISLYMYVRTSFSGPRRCVRVCVCVCVTCKCLCVCVCVDFHLFRCLYTRKIHEYLPNLRQLSESLSILRQIVPIEKKEKAWQYSWHLATLLCSTVCRVRSHSFLCESNI